MAFDFTGKKVLVTGAGRGIGRGIALALANPDCKVYALDCIQENLTKLAAENSTIVTIHQDLSNWEETRSSLEKLEVLDGLVNNAAIFHGMRSALEQTKEELEKYSYVNLFAYINCIQVIGKKMVDAGKKGSIINISSVLALNAMSGYLGYAVMKAGVEMVTKQFALELGPHNIRVNSVNPSTTNTEINDVLPNKAHVVENVIERTPMGRGSEIDDVVKPVMYLLSDHAAMVTGTTNPVDGGLGCNITNKQ